MFPAIGTGVSGYPMATAAKWHDKSIHIKEAQAFEEIRVVLFQQQMCQEFAEAFSSMKGGENWFLQF